MYYHLFTVKSKNPPNPNTNKCFRKKENFIHFLPSPKISKPLHLLPLRKEKKNPRKKNQIYPSIKMHVKSDSEVTSIEASTPPRSPRRPLYYVQSPSQHDVEKMSYGSSPIGSPGHHHHHYHCSPIHHSRESSTTRFSASLKNPRNPSPWKKMQQHNNNNNTHSIDDIDEDDEDDDVDDYRSPANLARFYIVCFVFSFVVLFALFSLILWGASRPYKPKISMKSIVFESFRIQAGMDNSGVPTDMLSLKSTVRMSYRNPATFFGVHVTSTPITLYYLQLKLASGNMEKFYQSRKSERKVVAMVQGMQVPLYGGVSTVLKNDGNGGGKRSADEEKLSVPLNMTFVVRSRAYVLGRLVKSTFHRSILCSITLKGNQLGKQLTLKDSCVYH